MCLKTDNTHSRLQVLRRPHVERPFYLPSDQVLHELNNNMTSFGDVIQVPPQLFEEMVSRLSPYLQRKVAYFPVALQVAVTLRYMATGCPLNELQKRFRVSTYNTATFIPEMCKAIIDQYKPEVLKVP